MALDIYEVIVDSVFGHINYSVSPHRSKSWAHKFADVDPGQIWRCKEEVLSVYLVNHIHITKNTKYWWCFYRCALINSWKKLLRCPEELGKSPFGRTSRHLPFKSLECSSALSSCLFLVFTKSKFLWIKFLLFQPVAIDGFTRCVIRISNFGFKFYQDIFLSRLTVCLTLQAVKSIAIEFQSYGQLVLDFS